MQRIADTLGISVETLQREAQSERYPDEVAELVRLWFKIRDPEAKRRVLEQVRGAAEEDRDRRFPRSG